ncbi:MAG: hypothetical protein NWF05_03290 [Candidatus Bathyarchaeota archaeon]|nr:hypothetical protein [Candidatus Bathyarchaeota archaeon]
MQRKNGFIFLSTLGGKKIRKPLTVAIVFFFLVLALTGTISLLHSTPSTVAATAPDVLWEQKLMAGEGYSVFPLEEGGFVLSATNQTATLLIKTDSQGNLTFLKAIQINQECTSLPYLVPTSDGGYALAGIWANNYTLVRTDSQSNVMWTHLYNANAPANYFRSIIQTRDGGFAIAGYAEEMHEGEGEIWFAKTDASGNLLWNKTFSGPIADCPSTLIQTADGGYMMSDVSFSVVPNQAYMRLIRTDPDGNVLWNCTYGDEDKYRIPECNCAIPTADGGYLIGGFLAGRNAWVVKTDADGNMQWNQTYGTENSAITCIQTTQDQGYIMAGVLNCTQAWLLKTDAEGKEHWNMTFTNATYPVGLEANFNSVLQTDDGGYIVIGTKNQSIWLLKLVTPNQTESDLLQTTLKVCSVAAVIVAAVLATALFRKQHSP